MHRAALNAIAPPFGFGRRLAPSPVDACHPSGSTPAPVVPHRSEPALEPGNYTVRLIVDGQSLTRPAVIKSDPRGLPFGAKPPENDHDDDE
jgi:hypothetical protein